MALERPQWWKAKAGSVACWLGCLKSHLLKKERKCEKKKKIVLKWHKQILQCTELAINAGVTEESLEKKHMKIMVVNEVGQFFYCPVSF
jgi:hypothetical protein